MARIEGNNKPESNLFLEKAQKIVAAEFPSLDQVPGDFAQIRREVDGLTLGSILERGQEIPIAGKELEGVYQVEEFFDSTTSAVMGNGGLVIKALREPKWRIDEGKPFSETASHPLFPWQGVDDCSDPKIGKVFQEASLLGELRAGVLYNSKDNPYYGLMGVRNAGDNQVELVGKGAIREDDNVYPALVMKKAPLKFNVANVLIEWQKGSWPELTEADMVNLVTQSVLAYDKQLIPATPELKKKFGTVDFFRRCLCYETPRQAADMASWPNADSVVKEAGRVMEEYLETIGCFLDKYPEYIENKVRNRVGVGHADSKFSNTSIGVTSREEVVNSIKDGEIPFVILDAQSLAVKQGLMHDCKGISYAHWRIVPREQQWAYALGQLKAMGLDEIHQQALAEIKQAAGWKENWTKLDQIWFLLQEGYKTGGVEPFVNSFGWLQSKKEASPLMEITMRKYPQAALKMTREAQQLL